MRQSRGHAAPGALARRRAICLTWPGSYMMPGLALMTLGLFNKIVLADSFLAGDAERVYDSDKIPGRWTPGRRRWRSAAGYPTTAIGAALRLGFAMPDNFRFPYAAVLAAKAKSAR